MAIKDWPDTQRPREKLLRLGARALSDAELLAIFLRTGTRGRSAVDLAHALLVEFGGLRPLLLADRRRFCAGMGLGDAKYAQLQAVLELARRHLSAQVIRGDSLTSPAATRNFLSAQLRDREQEVFACLFLDNRNRVVAFDEMFYGTVDRAEVHPREVVKRALHHNAAALILAHNHPSGIPEPSRADERITIRLRNALDLIGVRVLDHFIVGDGCVTSLAERGLL